MQMRCHYPGAHFVGFNLPPQCSCFTVKNCVLFFSPFFNSTSSCSHASISIGRPSSYPPSTKGNPQVSDVSPLSLSTTPPEVSIGIHQEPINCTVAINFKVPMITVDGTMIIKITPTIIALPFWLSLTMLMMCDDSKEMHKECAVHSKDLFCLLNQLLSWFSCFHHHHDIVVVQAH